jgi:hypothetical protein
MGYPASLGVAALVALSLASPAYAFDETKYPDLSGVWRKPPGIGNQWDQTKPLGLAQEPPFTPKYQAIFEASLADISAGGQGNDWPSRCVPFAMPRVMTVVFDMEIVVTPRTTYMLFAHSMPRHILTDGSDWPKEIEPTFLGYSLGKWIDTDGDGRYDVLEIETRGLKGPRTYEGTGMPFHEDNQTVVKERPTPSFTARPCRATPGRRRRSFHRSATSSPCTGFARSPACTDSPGSRPRRPPRTATLRT